jgi:hypothetical protein
MCYIACVRMMVLTRIEAAPQLVAALTTCGALRKNSSRTQHWVWAGSRTRVKHLVLLLNFDHNISKQTALNNKRATLK